MQDLSVAPAPHATVPCESDIIALPTAASQTNLDMDRNSPVGSPLQRPFADLPAWIWRLFFASWLVLLATFILIFAVNGETRFILGVVCAFAAAFFGIPLTLLRMTRRHRTRNTLDFVDILAGRCKASEAALQIVLLPIILCVGLIAIGFSIPR